VNQLDFTVDLGLRRRPVVLSLGGGLDSFAMLVEGIARGERIDVVVFIDVGHPDDPGEWPGTYRHIDEVVRPLCARHGIEFVCIDHSNYPVRDARSLFAWLRARKQIPMAGPNRICTTVAKVERFESWLDDRYPGQEVEVWIGFERGEESRADKDPNAGGRRRRRPGGAIRRNRFPLIERGLCRCACEDLVRRAGFPVPRKSACVFCPYGTKGDWQRFAVDLPEQFARVVKLEADKPPTAKNGRKLSIMAYNSKTQTGTPLDRWVATPYTPQRDRKPCKVCGRAVRATKAAGCGYLEPGPAAASHTSPSA
jgi:hypothetical protein